MNLFHRQDRERGAALVEMAFVMPLLLLILVGSIEFSRAWSTRVTMVHAAREGARVLSVTGDQTAAENAAAAASVPLDPGLVTISSTVCVPGDPASVSLSYPFSYSILFFGSGTINLETTSIMRCGG